MMKLPFINRIFPSYRSKIIAIIIGGIIVGGGALFMYMLRAHTYLGDDPAACVNCHIMSPYYATWFHSSHARDATCNDCHVPHENIVKKWTFKGMDGMKHVAAFLTKSEPQVIQAHEASSQPSSMLGVPHCSMKLNRTRFSYSTVLGGVCTLTYLPRLENRGLPLDPGSPGTTN